MQNNLPQTISLLTQTPATLNALLRDLPETWTHRDEGPNTWTAFDVIAHLNHCERTNWMPRAKMILDSGESQPFTPLDREARAEDIQKQTLPQLLDEFARLRSENLHQLRALNLTPQDLEKRGLHPASARNSLPASRHMGHARSHPPPSALQNPRPPAPRSRRPLETIISASCNAPATAPLSDA